MSPLLVAWAPYDVQGAELGHSHFIGWQARMWAEINISGWIRARFLKRTWLYCSAFYFLTTTYVLRLLLQRK